MAPHVYIFCICMCYVVGFIQRKDSILLFHCIPFHSICGFEFTLHFSLHVVAQFYVCVHTICVCMRCIWYSGNSSLLLNEFPFHQWYQIDHILLVHLIQFSMDIYWCQWHHSTNHTCIRIRVCFDHSSMVNTLEVW